MKNQLFRLLAVVMVVSLFLTSAAFAQVPEPPQPPVDAKPLDKPLGLSVAEVRSLSEGELELKGALHTADGKVRVMVEFSDPALAVYSGGIGGFTATSPQATGRSLDVNSASSKAYIGYLSGKQADFAKQLSAKTASATVVKNFQVAFNGMTVAIAEKDVTALLKMPGVKNVYPEQIRVAQMDASLGLIGAPELWTRLGGQSEAGKGIKVADIDSGLYVSNPMFSGEGFTAPYGYPKGYCVENPTDTDFQCNGKVIAARFFFDPAIAGSTSVDEVMSPLDINGHGSHTAGTSAGNSVELQAGVIAKDAVSISGVAPSAYLMVYKALFHTPDGRASGTDTMLVAALEAALADGADVINNSWGGGAGGDPNSSVYNSVIANISAAGTLVVFSAGNDGPGSTTIGCPGCVESALTVAASTTNRIVANPFNVTGPGTVPAELTNLAALAGDGPQISANLSGTLGYLGSNALGCNAFPAGTFTGKVALVKRGTCSFSIKINNAAAAGAVGVIVVNNAGGPPSAMSTPGTSIPSYMLSIAQGTPVIDWVVAHADAAVTIGADKALLHNDAWQNILASFSSVGPNGDPNVLKPDITAPGVNILSAYSTHAPGATDGVYAFEQGTSMSAPHVTGAAALMFQLHSDWTPMQVRTALTSTAYQSMLMPDAKTPAGAFNMGAGRLDLAAAADAGLTFSQSSFAAANCVIDCSWTATLTNVSGKTATWNAQASVDSPLSVKVEPASFTIPAGMTAEFTVTVHSLDGDLGDWYFGAVDWVDAAGEAPTAHMPVVVMPGNSTSPLTVSHWADQKSVLVNTTADFHVGLMNTTVDPVVMDVVIPIPDNAEYVPAVIPTSNGVGAAFSSPYDLETNSLHWQIGVTGSQLAVDPFSEGPWPYFAGNPSSAASLLLNPYCSSDCDEDVFRITGMDYYYMGQHYDSIYISSNGFVTAGDLSTSAPVPSMLPNPAQPNLVIAPMWADLDPWSMIDSQVDGSFFLWGASDGVSTYTVIEWQNVQPYGNSDEAYNFQLWIEDGTEFKWFHYGPQTSALGSFPVSIGAEDATGQLGGSIFYSDGSVSLGTAPVEENAVVVVGMPGTAQIDYQLRAIGGNFEPIVSVANVYNNINSIVETAFAKVNVDFLKLFVPVVLR